MKILAIVSYKGGTGKTTTAINIAYELTRLGYKTLLVDTDGQGNAGYSVINNINTRYCLYDALTDSVSIQKCIYRSRFENLDIIPCRENIEQLANIEPNKLSDRLRSLIYEPKKYDYIVIDCHPNMQIATISSIVAADDVIIPICADIYSLAGVELMQEYIEQIKEYNPDINILGCLITKYRNVKSQNTIIAKILEETTYNILDVCISSCEAVNSAQLVRKPLGKHRKSSKAATEYKQLTKYYIEQTKGV